MKNLQLRKTETKNKAGKFLYEVIEEKGVIATRRSHREYVACLVAETSEGYYLPNFFSRKDLIGKGESRHLFGKCYALAELSEEKKEDSLQKFNRIFEKHEGKFQKDVMLGSLHNFLWQIIVNEKWNKPGICVYAVMSNDFDGYELAIVEKDYSGYRPMGVRFIGHEYNSVTDIAVEISTDIWGHTSKEVNKIVSSSMR